MAVMRLLLPVLITASLWGQGSPLPYSKIQYFSNSGQPLAGGQLCSYLTGTTTPAATFTDYTLSTQNPLCVPLDSSGRAAIWIGATVYRIVLKDSTGVTIWTQDGIAAAGGAQPFYNATNTAGPAYEVQGSIVIDAGRNATFNTLTCTSTPCGSGGGGGGSGTPGGSATNVQFNAGGTPATFGGASTFTFNSTSQLLTVQSLSSATAGIAVANGFIQADSGFLATSGVANNFNTIQAPTGGMEALSFTAAKYVQTGHGTGPPAATTADTIHQGSLYWDDGSHAEQVFNGSAWVSLGGGTGSPGGSTTQVQFNSSGSFAGSANLTFASNQLTVTGVVDVSVGVVSHGTANNTIQAPNGGISGQQLVTTDSLFFLEEAQPALSAGGQARIYADSTAHNLQISQNGGAYTSFGGGAGNPAGSNTQLQYNNSGAFGASPNLTFASNQLTVTGSISSTIGLFTTNIASNAIQAPSGGVLGAFLTATDSLFWIEEAQPALSGLGQARLYADNASHTLRLSQNGGPYGPLSGGGSGSAGANTQVQYSTGGGGFGASANFTFGSQLLSVTAIDAAHAGMAVATGYMQADAGFLATTGVATAYNAFYAPTAGMAGKSFTALNYVQTGTYSAALATGPTVTASDSFHAGALSWSTAGSCEAVFNGSTWACITGGGGGGITSINSQSGPTLTIFGTTNEITVAAATNAITLSTPQPIATTSNVTFGSVTTGAGGVIQSGATGSSIAFQNTNFNFQVDGNGNLSTQKVIINGTNGSSLSNGNLIINESTTAGGNISMKHQGNLDATWQAGSSAALDVVDNGSNHKMVILQGGAVLIGRTTDDGTASKLEVFDAGTARAITATTGNAISAVFQNSSTNQTVEIVNSSTGTGLVIVSSGIGINDLSSNGIFTTRLTSNGTNGNIIGTGNIIINESTTLGEAISMKHQGINDASWQAGSSSAMDIVDDTNNHRFVILQGTGTTLINRTSVDGSTALLQVNGGISSASTGSTIAFQNTNSNFTVDGNGNVTGQKLTSAGTNGNTIGNGNLILNESTGLGASISMKHQGTLDASWNSGTSAAFDVVDNTASSHRFIVLQGGTTLIGRTSTDGTGALLEVNGVISSTGLNVNGNAGLTGTFTCPGGQHFNSITFASGIATSFSCN